MPSIVEAADPDGDRVSTAPAPVAALRHSATAVPLLRSIVLVSACFTASALGGCGSNADEIFTKAAGYEVEGCEDVSGKLVDGSTLYECAGNLTGAIDAEGRAFITGESGGGPADPVSISSKEIEEQIEGYITKRGGSYASVSCPTGYLDVENNSMDCVGTGDGGDSLTITATLHNGEVRITSG